MDFVEIENQSHSKIPIIDNHAHLNELNDLFESLKNAKESGVMGIIAVGVDVESNKKILKISGENNNYVYPAIGYHPWEIKEEGIEENINFIRNHVMECVGLGEIGLDYKIKLKKEIQWRVFQELLNISIDSGKPIIIHCRFSHHKAFEMVRERNIKKAVFHWYSGPLDLLNRILSEGYYISATPALNYSPLHREAIKRAPLERILLETDTPVAYKGRESRPKDVWISLEKVAELKGLDLTFVAKQTTINAIEFFQIPKITKLF